MTKGFQAYQTEIESNLYFCEYIIKRRGQLKFINMLCSINVYRSVRAYGTSLLRLFSTGHVLALKAYNKTIAQTPHLEQYLQTERSF